MTPRAKAETDRAIAQAHFDAPGTLRKDAQKKALAIVKDILFRRECGLEAALYALFHEELDDVLDERFRAVEDGLNQPELEPLRDSIMSRDARERAALALVLIEDAVELSCDYDDDREFPRLGYALQILDSIKGFLQGAARHQLELVREALKYPIEAHDYLVSPEALAGGTRTLVKLIESDA